MTSKKKITAAEKQEFIDSMKNNNTSEIEHKAIIPQVKQPKKSQSRAFNSSYDTAGYNDWHKGDDELHFARNGVSPKVLKKLKQGVIAAAGFLDLHGKTVIEAAQLLEQFILDHQNASSVCLLVIHGKGKQSKDGKAVLKNKVAEWLEQDSRVLAFHSALPRDGGNGALYVLTKKR